MQISSLNQYLPNLGNHESYPKTKIKNLMKYLKEEVDQCNIGLYICERSSDLKKCDVLKNLWKPDIDYDFPVHIDKKNAKDKRNFS